MEEKKEYFARNIDVYCYEEKMIRMGRNFHIVVDNGNQYYVNVVNDNGFRTVNRSQLKGLVKIPFLTFVGEYNLICERCNNFNNMQDIKAQYTKDELVMINNEIGELFNWPTHDENSEEHVKVRKKTKYVL